MNDQECDSELPILIEGKEYPNIVRNPLHEITRTSFCLGILFGISLGLLPYLYFKPFHLYVMALSLFHFLEYYITAKYNPGKVHSESFLLNNGSEYLLAHTVGSLECLVESYFKPEWKMLYGVRLVLSCIGLLLVCMGQIIRTVAMYTAAQSFSHILKTKKQEDHVLVKNGIYRYLRHPSYFGFYWWAIGTQLLMLNPISLLIFSYVLWRFFSKRIRVEEKYLIEFFSKEYIQYKSQVRVGIPFIE